MTAMHRRVRRGLRTDEPTFLSQNFLRAISVLSSSFVNISSRLGPLPSFDSASLRHGQSCKTNLSTQARGDSVTFQVPFPDSLSPWNSLEARYTISSMMSSQNNVLENQAGLASVTSIPTGCARHGRSFRNPWPSAKSSFLRELVTNPFERKLPIIGTDESGYSRTVPDLKPKPFLTDRDDCMQLSKLSDQYS